MPICGSIKHLNFAANSNYYDFFQWLVIDIEFTNIGFLLSSYLNCILCFIFLFLSNAFVSIIVFPISIILHLQLSREAFIENYWCKIIGNYVICTCLYEYLIGFLMLDFPRFHFKRKTVLNKQTSTLWISMEFWIKFNYIPR